MSKLFTVLDFNKDETSNKLCVEITNHSLEIPLNQFNTWLKRTDRLHWVHDYTDHNGEHVQETGEYTFDTYWGMAWNYIAHDIYEFVVNFIDPTKGINSINQILSTYAK